MPSLAKSNRHLATPAQRQRVVRVTIATSSAIEGIHAPFKGATKVVKVRAKSAAKKVASKVVEKAATTKKVANGHQRLESHPPESWTHMPRNSGLTCAGTVDPHEPESPSQQCLVPALLGPMFEALRRM